MKDYTFLDFERIVQLNKLGCTKTFGGSDGSKR
jgi:hypothetical protein